MKINSIYIYLFLLAISCKQNKTDTISNNYTKDTLDDEIFGIIVGNNIEDTCFNYVHNGIKFSKCIDGNYYTKYRTTNDSNFITEDNVYIAMPFNSVKKNQEKSWLQSLVGLFIFH